MRGENMRDVAIIGVGQTKFGRTDRTCVELFAEAAHQAMEDAGVTPKEIEGLWIGNCLGSHYEGIANIAPHLAWEIGAKTVPAFRLEGACSSATYAFILGWNAVASGLFDIVIVGGTERTLIAGTPYATRTFAMGDELYASNTGSTFPGVFASAATMYAKKYDIPIEKLREMMAHVSIKNHAHAARNPKAQFYKKYGDLKVEDVLSARMIAWPLTLLDCCPFTDGASAAILCSADIARRYTDEPIYVLGVGAASGGGLSRHEEYIKAISRIQSSRRALKMAGLSPDDIQVLMAHDCFTIAEILIYEQIGFFDWGKGAEAAAEGQTDIGGRIPVNPDGGLMGKGHPVGATGVAQVYSLVKQLRGEEVKGNQVTPVPEVGMTDNLGGTFASLGHIVLGRSKRRK